MLATSPHTPLTSVPEKAAILGTGVSATSYGEVLRVCRAWIDESRGVDVPRPARLVYVACVHSLMAAVNDAPMRATFNSSEITTPDGMPLVWALRDSGFPQQKRVYGPNLMLALCGQAARLGHRIYLYGGTDASLAQLRENLLRRFPSLLIAGAWSPPFRPLTEAEETAAIQAIRATRADIVFVGLGAPKQERWMERNRSRLPGTVMVGVGAAFDFHAGKVRQAPPWIQQAGLEWLFRLVMEPKRLWKRYLLVTPWFIPLYGLQRAGILKYPKLTKQSTSEVPCIT